MLKGLKTAALIALVAFVGRVSSSSELSASGHSMNCQSMNGCAMKSNTAQTEKKFGKVPDSLALKVEIQDLLKTPEGYLEKTVIIQGRVREECPGGHWLVLENPKDTSSTIFVDFTKAGFVVPQMIGAGALVYGRFVINDDNPNIAGLGVTFEDRAHAPSGHSGHESGSNSHSCH